MSSKQLGERFGNHLRSLRRRRGLTQETLAKRSDLSVEAVQRIERGAFSPTLGTLAKLARGLQVSLRTLFQSFERKRKALADEICDFIARKSDRELTLLWRIIRSLFRRPPTSGRSEQP